VGFSAGWFAVQGAPRDEVLAAVGLEPAGERADGPDFRFGLAELPRGWTLVWFHEDLETAFKHAVALSRHGPAVACAIEEHVMFSEARGFAEGAEA
jgi:hypothetical protein